MFLGLVAHPLAVVAHVLGQPLGALPLLAVIELAARLRVHGRTPRELRRDLDHCLVDEHRDGVEVRRIRLQAEPLRFERQRAATGEGIMECRELVPVEQLLRPRVVGVLRARPPP